ncbi:MAG TPA: hypothetical protein VN397_03275 [Candidatus Methylomirabilis sp.]|nr:hypothetical protein [Candidatus Methylomirabilis sp.]
MNRLMYLAIAALMGCGTSTTTSVVHSPNGEEVTKTNKGPYSSDSYSEVKTEQAFRECRDYNAPTMGSSGADMYCRSLTTGSRGVVPIMPFGPSSYLMPAAPGAHEYAGSIADPQAAGYATANAHADATYPEASKNPGDFARRSEVRVIVREVHRLGDDIAATDADLQKHKKKPAKK